MLRRLRCAGLAFAVLLFVTIAPIASARTIPAAPTDSPILDNAELLSPGQELSLSEKIAQERSRSSNQIAILTIPSLEGDSLEEYSITVAREWGIGEQGKDNGVLLLVARDDRQVRIEVGYGLEGTLTDVQASRIIRSEITPSFINGEYFDGINKGLDGIIYVLSGDGVYLEPPDNLQTENENAVGGVIMSGVILFSWIGSILARTKSWWGGGVVGGVLGASALALLGITAATIVGGVIAVGAGLLFDYFVSKNYKKHRRSGTSPSWWAGGSHFGGGSSGGFGGGGFGGGGASGRW